MCIYGSVACVCGGGVIILFSLNMCKFGRNLVWGPTHLQLLPQTPSLLLINS